MEKKMKKLDQISYTFLEAIGFNSWSDLILDTLVLRVKYIGLYLIGFLFTSVAYFFDAMIKNYTVFDGYINDYIYSPSKAIQLLFLTTLANLVLGFSNSRRKGNPADGYKFMKALVRFCIQVVFIYFLYSLSKLYPETSIDWVVHVLMIAFILSTFWSAWNNAQELGFVNDDVHALIIGILDIRQLVPALKNMKLKDKNKPDKGENGV